MASSLHGPIREPHRTINRTNNNNNLAKVVSPYYVVIIASSLSRRLYCRPHYCPYYSILLTLLIYKRTSLLSLGLEEDEEDKEDLGGDGGESNIYLLTTNHHLIFY